MKRHNNSPPAPEREELERQLESLQRDIRQLQLERDLLRKAVWIRRRLRRCFRDLVASIASQVESFSA
jgi:hypothetical protein